MVTLSPRIIIAISVGVTIIVALSIFLGVFFGLHHKNNSHDPNPTFDSPNITVPVFSASVTPTVYRLPNFKFPNFVQKQILQNSLGITEYIETASGYHMAVSDDGTIVCLCYIRERNKNRQGKSYVVIDIWRQSGTGEFIILPTHELAITGMVTDIVAISMKTIFNNVQGIISICYSNYTQQKPEGVNQIRFLVWENLSEFTFLDQVMEDENVDIYGRHMGFAVNDAGDFRFYVLKQGMGAINIPSLIEEYTQTLAQPRSEFKPQQKILTGSTQFGYNGFIVFDNGTELYVTDPGVTDKSGVKGVVHVLKYNPNTNSYKDNQITYPPSIRSQYSDWTNISLSLDTDGTHLIVGSYSYDHPHNGDIILFERRRKNKNNNKQQWYFKDRFHTSGYKLTLSQYSRMLVSGMSPFISAANKIEILNIDVENDMGFLKKSFTTLINEEPQKYIIGSSGQIIRYSQNFNSIYIFANTIHGGPHIILFEMNKTF